jgi:hypothetical protein
MVKEIKLKSGVYAVVNVDTGDVLASATFRDHARAQLQHVKSQSDNPRSLKLFKMKPEKVVR